ncbi:MAG: hypothetical protein ABR508_04370 [Candidatus Baltobacteraceae bacterium]
MDKKVVLRTLAVAGLVLIARFALKTAGELARYDRIRAMSNEGPVLEETPDMLLQIAVQERQTFKEWGAFFKSLPRDIARYVKIESM